MIRSVVFDFADTIAELIPNKEDIVVKYLLDRFSIIIDKKYVSRAYKSVNDFVFYSSLKIRDREDRKRFYKKYNSLVFKSLGLYHLVGECIDEYFEYFSSLKKRWVLKDGTLHVFRTLQLKDINVIIASNFDERLRDIVSKELCIGNYIKHVFISQEVEVEKPHEEFYRLLVKRHHLRPSETLYVGDSYMLDYLPGLGIGFRVILLDEKKLYCVGDYTVANIEEVLQYI